MKFDELYAKYVAGNCTEEEKAFVESEIEKAQKVNDALLTGRKIELAPAEEEKIKKVKKKFSLKMALTAAVVTVAVLLLVSGGVLGGVFGTAVTAAKDGNNYGYDGAEALALDRAYDYLTENKLFDGNKSALVVTDREKDFEIKTPLKKSLYVYSFDIAAGRLEIEIEVNSRTGECRITDIDR